MSKVMGMIPGMSAMADGLGDVDVERDMQRLFGIIDSMTGDERLNPTKTVDQSRRRRIAAGAGVEPHEVNELVKQFDFVRSQMQEMAGLGMRDRLRKVQELSKNGFMNPGAKLAKQKKRTGKRLSKREKEQLRKQRERETRRRKREKKDK